MIAVRSGADAEALLNAVCRGKFGFEFGDCLPEYKCGIVDDLLDRRIDFSFDGLVLKFQVEKRDGHVV